MLQTSKIPEFPRRKWQASQQLIVGLSVSTCQIVLADDNGFVYAAAVNVEEEFVEMLEAKRQYQNNIEVVTTLRALMMRTINMGK